MNYQNNFNAIHEVRDAIMKAEDQKERLQSIAKAQRKKKKKTSHIMEEIKTLQTEILRLEIYKDVLEREQMARQPAVRKRSFFDSIIRFFGA